MCWLCLHITQGPGGPPTPGCFGSTSGEGRGCRGLSGPGHHLARLPSRCCTRLQERLGEVGCMCVQGRETDGGTHHGSATHGITSGPREGREGVGDQGHPRSLSTRVQVGKQKPLQHFCQGRFTTVTDHKDVRRAGNLKGDCGQDAAGPMGWKNKRGAGVTQRSGNWPPLVCRRAGNVFLGDEKVASHCFDADLPAGILTLSGPPGLLLAAPFADRTATGPQPALLPLHPEAPPKAGGPEQPEGRGQP